MDGTTISRRLKGLSRSALFSLSMGNHAFLLRTSVSSGISI